MTPRNPCSLKRTTAGRKSWLRMVDKIRLVARGELDAAYHEKFKTADRTCWDVRCIERGALKVLACLTYTLWLFPSSTYAGDAVAIAYNETGVWTAVTYYASSAPKGGADYKDSAGARAAALADLKKRGGADFVRGSVLESSDKTGYFAYARGKNRAKKDLHAVGYGPSAAAAKADAFAALCRTGGTKEQKMIYKYFSYGAAPAQPSP